jgi:hypothetical protein
MRAEEREDRRSPTRLVRRRPAGSAVTAGNAEQANLSGFRIKAGHQSSRAESAICNCSH